MADTIGGMGSSLANWAQSNPDSVMKLGGQLAPMFGLYGVGQGLTAAGGATQMGMQSGRAKDYQSEMAKAKSEGKEFTKKPPMEGEEIAGNTFKQMRGISDARPKPPPALMSPPRPGEFGRSPGTPAAGKIQSGSGVVGSQPSQANSGMGMGGPLEQMAMMLLQQQQRLG